MEDNADIMLIHADGMRIVYREISINSYLGRQVDVTIDRPLGSRHPEYRDCIYEVNYGHVPGTIAADKEEIDAYVLEEDKPLKNFTGRVIAIVERSDDNESKLVVAAPGKSFTTEQIAQQIHFQEKYFRSKIIMAK